MSEHITPWQSVSPRYVAELMLESSLTFLIFSGFATVPLWLAEEDIGVFSWYPLAAVLLVAAVVIGFVPRRVRAIGFALRNNDVVFRKGILFQRSVAVPYGRLQLVDVSRGPLSRLLGLSQLSLVTAAASTGVTISGLPQHKAEELRDHLIALAETRRAGL
jgi:hypothetical protein